MGSFVSVLLCSAHKLKPTGNVGMGPVRKLLLTSNATKALSCEIDSGSCPEMLFRDKERISRELRFPIEKGNWSCEAAVEEVKNLKAGDRW